MDIKAGNSNNILFKTFNVALFEIDIRKKLVKINNCFEDFGKENFNIILSYEDAAKYIAYEDRKMVKTFYENINNLNDKKCDLQYRIRQHNNIVWVKSSNVLIRDEDNNVIYVNGFICNYSEEKEKDKKIMYMNYYDTATGLFNKRYLKQYLAKFIRNKKKTNAMVMFIDMDNFKYINDTFGHDYGDLLLKRISRKIEDNISYDHILTRFGGDEFVIVVPGEINLKQVQSFCGRMIELFNTPVNVGKETIIVSASIGVAIYPYDGDDYRELLKNADAALSKAKNSGKNKFQVFDKTLYGDLRRKYEIELNLSAAIKNNELYVEFQPKIALNSNEVTGFEALLRWNSRKLGIVSPAEFIPVAEHCRLIIPVGRFVIEETFRKCRKMLDFGFDKFNIALNLSEIQLRNSEIVDEFISLAGKYDVKPKYIEIEITESMLMKSIERNIDILTQLKDAGFKIVLDDFGTGYSSLNYLTKLPIDILKIDKSFVDGVMNNDKNRCIVEKIIDLSHNLGIEVIAEGVELEAQAKYLKSIFCDYIQGYYYSRPLSFDDAVAMISR